MLPIVNTILGSLPQVGYRPELYSNKPYLEISKYTVIQLSPLMNHERMHFSEYGVIKLQMLPLSPYFQSLVTPHVFPITQLEFYIAYIIFTLLAKSAPLKPIVYGSVAFIRFKLAWHSRKCE